MRDGKDANLGRTAPDDLHCSGVVVDGGGGVADWEILELEVAAAESDEAEAEVDTAGSESCNDLAAAVAVAGKCSWCTEEEAELAEAGDDDDGDESGVVEADSFQSKDQTTLNRTYITKTVIDLQLSSQT